MQSFQEKEAVLFTIPIVKERIPSRLVTTQKAKTFNFCSVILHFYFCILKGFVPTFRGCSMKSAFRA